MQYQRAFLKWAGGKYRLLDKILAILPTGNTLIEPFVGAGSVFLNADFKKYLLCDSNQDLINLYLNLQSEGDYFIKYSKQFCQQKYNNEKTFYQFRERFNKSTDEKERSALFIYLNRHGFNGLCRYNSDGGFNVPFGRYKTIYFPEQAMQYFHEKSQLATFVCQDFSACFRSAKKNVSIYCDPPYVPLSESSNFTEYQKLGFSLEQQIQLAELAKKASSKGSNILLSNHDTEFTRKAYQGSEIISFSVQRLINCQADKRRKVKELLAYFSEKPSSKKNRSAAMAFAD